jgi:signal transduction histidine kinase
MKPGGPARLSIGVKLPLVAGALVLVVGIALSSAAFIALKRITVGAATERLTILTAQLSESYRLSTAQLLGQVRSTARNDAVGAYLRSRQPALRQRALAALEYHGLQSEQVLDVQLRDQSGRLLLATNPRAGRLGAAASDRFPRPAGPDSMVLGDLRQRGDSIIYPAVALVPGEPVGYVVQWRQVGSAPRTREQIARILGSGGGILFGNADGSFWTDLTSAIPAPPIDPRHRGTVVKYSRPGGPGAVFAAAGAVIGSPWLFAVEFPARAVLAPAHSFLRMMAVIAILCITGGIALALLLSRQITTPLQHLSDATDAIAAGDSSRRVHLARADELGRLGASFDAMAAQVEESRHRLEDRVAVRTRELNETLQQLQDAQETLVRKEKLALMGQLASGVGHELRNPLGVMSNAVYYLEHILAPPPGEVREYLAMLRQQIALSEKIVSDLLDFARASPAERQATELRSLTAAQLRRVRPLDGFRVEQDFPDGLPPVHVDPVHAGQVVLNLLTNAVQAMGDAGGTLRIRGGLNGDGHVLLEVSDTGPGIRPEHLEKIFEPLFTTKARGIGLGLAVSRSLAQANGGDLTVRSTPGSGATFLFTMPVVPEQG